MYPSVTLSQPCVQPAELDFDCAIRKFAPKSKQRLSASFQPLADSVIIGKGKMPAQASGNKRLRVLVNLQIENYGNAKFKRDKTYIVTNIVHIIQELCPVGAFVKFDGERWWQVSDRISREKVACMFRDSLSGQYKSSNKNKVAKRRAKRAVQRSAVLAMEQKKENEMIPPLIVSSYSFLPKSTTEPALLPRCSLLVLEGLDLGCLLDSVDRNVFDSTDFFGDEGAATISSDEASFVEIAL
jgi:hypothetical protein